MAGGVVAEEVGAAVGFDSRGAAVAEVVAGGFAFEDFAVFVEVGDGLEAADFVVGFGGFGAVGEVEGGDFAVFAAVVAVFGGLRAEGGEEESRTRASSPRALYS